MATSFWLIAAGIEAHRSLFDQVSVTVEEIRRLRAAAQAIAQLFVPVQPPIPPA